MDNQKKQTSDHESLVREWLQNSNHDVLFVVPVKFTRIKKGAFYACFSKGQLSLFEVIKDRDVKPVETHDWEKVENIMFNPTWRKYNVIIDQTLELSFPEDGERVIEFLSKKQDIKVIEFKKNWINRILGK